MSRTQPAQWVEYEWNVRGERALFGVDLSLADNAPDAARPIMLRLSSTGRKPRSESLNESELRSCRRILARCGKTVDGVYAGFIKRSCQWDCFFYVASVKCQDMAEDAADAEQKVITRVECAEDTHWKTYFKILYPDAAKYQTILNREYIGELVKNGDRAAVPRRLNLYMYFPTRPLQVLFCEQARISGFAIGNSVYSPEQELSYGVVLHCISALNPLDVDAVTTRAIRVSEKYDGTLVYWDCSLIASKRR